MAESDPISDTTPNKRRRLDNSGSKTYDSQDDSGEEYTAEDLEGTSTLPQKRKQLSYPAHAFRADIESMNGKTTASTSSPQRAFHVTQPTQPLPTQTLQHVTQPTQLLPPLSKLSSPARVLVDRSSPTLPHAPSSSPSKPPPAPLPAPFARSRGNYLGAALAGTNFRSPLGVQPKPAVVSLVSDDDDDPPVPHSSDDETQGLSSNIRPTVFKKGGRGLNSTPNRTEPIVHESPRSDGLAGGPGGSTFFGGLMNKFGHDDSRAPARRPADDSISAYGSVSRGPRPTQGLPSRAQPVVSNAVRYQTLDDVEDYGVRRKIEDIRGILSTESVQRCHDALMRSRGNKEDAMAWLAETDAQAKPDHGDVDPLGTATPVVKRGVAMTKSTLSSQPVRSAKQEVKVPTKTIAERYAPTQPQRRASRPNIIPKILGEDDEEEEDARPKRRLLMGRKSRRSPTPPSSPPAQKLPQARQRLQQRGKNVITISSDDDEEVGGEDKDSDDGRAESEEEDAPTETAFDARLLTFFNDCSVQALADLSALAETAVSFVLEQRPFASLDAIRAISNAGPKSKAQRMLGDRLVNRCSEMLSGYEAVDELVEECAKLAKPIQKALKGWGVVGREDGGELELMNLDDAHDSGIGTPASSDTSEAMPAKERKFLKQPSSMAEDMPLKDYQLVGLNWLNLLWQKKISCILADDMGLGKTCQVIAFLAHLQEQEIDGVHLIIVPGSTIANWLREFARFAPSLSVFPYYGSDKERPELRLRIEQQFEEIDVVVTTYDVATRPDDNRFLRKSVRPAVCVFDEAHLLRNPKTDRYQKLLRIPADFRLFLTGTPLQNNLRELVAILAFIMPNLFEEKRDKLDFIFDQKAITKDGNHAALLSAERIARARTMMTPFILRRKKAQVLDLPAKHRRVEMCTMLPSQAAYYASLVDEARASMSGTAAEKKRKSSNIMMALRKAAIHPLLSRRLYTEKKIDKIVAILQQHDFAGNSPDKIRAYITGESKTGQNLEGGDFALHKFCTERSYLQQFELKKQQWMDSGKVQRFKELVTAYAANGDRVLVFSQFTTLMDILEAVLETLKIPFVRLDGSTKMETRQDLIDTFTRDESLTVFMLSTKAGGAGINLAAANKVIVFDSGFNPQDDVQAENRAHRVGQTREVEVVRLVCAGTIEEQILRLGESKLALDERVTAGGEEEAEREGKKVVERMFLESLKGGVEGGGGREGGDVRDAFRMGLEGSGVRVASKQAVF
ncbi:DNA-dependent ATPase fun30 [Friedmanniomyces endolithicus]|nr:DNA-dependent ATPase fun30 [Friedmanniomyces endolithicus]